jgi:hypothetical protein
MKGTGKMEKGREEEPIFMVMTFTVNIITRIGAVAKCI